MDNQPPALRIPTSLEHSRGARTDAELAREVKVRHDTTPGVRFLVDVLGGLHAGPNPLRGAEAFHARFPARRVMEALAQRPDLRARIVHALTGAPPTLLRRSDPGDLARLVELLVEEDLPSDERQVRAEGDRGLSVKELFFKYLDMVDLCVYLAPEDLWLYESEDRWWEKPTESSRRMMAAELKSIRRHRIIPDTEILDMLGNDVLERDLPLAVRAAMRAASRRCAQEGKAFTDTLVFDFNRSPDGTRDLVDDLVRCMALPHLRKAVERAAEVLGLDMGHAARPAAPVVARDPPAPVEARDLLPSIPPLPAGRNSEPPGVVPLLELSDDESFGADATQHGKTTPPEAAASAATPAIPASAPTPAIPATTASSERIDAPSAARLPPPLPSRRP